MTAALAGKVAVITGAENGPARGLALALAEAGAAIALLGDAHALAPLVADLEAADARAVAIGTDFESGEHTNRVFAQAADALQGPIELVLHGAVPAVAYEPRDFVDLDDARWEAIWESAMRTMLFVFQAGFAQMDGRGGRFLLITPTVSMSGAARFAPYVAVLEAQRVLAKSAARQWGASGITVNCLAPAPEHVPIGVDSMTVSLAPPAFGGPGDVQRDLGPVAVFLAGDDAHFVTGATFNVDGGVWMAP
jgi:NAD(P)-dependent dehydrogenase (short-subunit alcohol dehydrogenase family)